jgi:hypothetical protein
VEAMISIWMKTPNTFLGVMGAYPKDISNENRIRYFEATDTIKGLIEWIGRLDESKTITIIREDKNESTD